ncbi:hypothetical protein ACQKWADRAFT_312966 [Trichoderma austrokoningii]
MPQSRVALFLGMDISVTMLALAVVVLRVAHRRAHNRLNTSDYLICTAMFTVMLHLVLDILITALFGYARHQKDLPPSLQGSWKTLFMFWLIQIFTKLPLLFSKLSLTFVYRGLMLNVDHPSVRVARFVNYGLMVLIIGFFTSATIASTFACTPVYKSWLPKTPGKCIDTTIMFNYVTGSVNIFTSACLICIPFPVLLLNKNKARIETKQFTALVLFGLVDTAISIVRLHMITDLRNIRSDLTWLMIPTHIMIVVEYNVTIIAASLVVMRPAFQSIFDFFTGGSANRNANHSFNITKASNGESRDGILLTTDIVSMSTKNESIDNRSIDHILPGNF